MSGLVEDQKVHISDNDSGKDAANYDAKGDIESSSAGEIVEDTARVVDHKAERALCRKFDFRLLPVLAIMCKLLMSLFQQNTYYL